MEIHKLKWFKPFILSLIATLFSQTIIIDKDALYITIEVFVIVTSFLYATYLIWKNYTNSMSYRLIGLNLLCLAVIGTLSYLFTNLIGGFLTMIIMLISIYIYSKWIEVKIL